MKTNSTNSYKFKPVCSLSSEISFVLVVNCMLLGLQFYIYNFLHKSRYVEAVVAIIMVSWVLVVSFWLVVKSVDCPKVEVVSLGSDW